MSLDHYFLLGPLGLRVNRLALGTMTFGNARDQEGLGAWVRMKMRGAICSRYRRGRLNFVRRIHGAGL